MAAHSFYADACKKFLDTPFESAEDESIFKMSLEVYSSQFPDKPGIALSDLSGKTIAIDNKSIIVWKGDITQLKVDAIVNAANESLLGGGGVDYAIHQAAGPALVKECATLGGCEVGEAKMTKSYRLPCKFVLHTVGPLLHEDGTTKPNELARCYQSCLRLCEQHGLQSIAFCCISCGFYGFPNAEAARIEIGRAHV
jgi:O-acetyl-ADP-ribose deacetylase (regulator of RNase III)